MGNKFSGKPLQDKVDTKCDSTDPIADLFAGIGFRNSGKAEAIRRLHRYRQSIWADASNSALAGNKEILAAAQANTHALQSQIARLEQSIRQIKAHQAEEIIQAITRSPYVGGEVAQGLAKAVLRG